MKNKFWLTIIAIIIVLPTVIALTNYIIKKDAPVTEISVSEGSLVIPLNGAESEPYTFKLSDNKLDLNNIDSNMLKYFTDVTEKSKKVSGLPDTVANLPHFTLTLTSYNRPVVYKYYFTPQVDRCYFTDDKDNCYIIPSNYAKAFLISKYGMSLFESSTIPTYSTPTSEVILPDSVVWKYRTVDASSYSQITETNENANGDKVFPIVQSFEFIKFDIEPSSVKVTISHEGEILAQDKLLDQIAFTDIPGNVTLDVSVTASWYETEHRKSDGTIIYNFKCIVNDAPVFQITYNTAPGEGIYAGDFLCVTAMNILGDGSSISFTSNLSTDITPVFYKDGLAYRALIPLDTALAEGEYTLNLSANGTEQSFTITIADNPYDNGIIYAEEISSDKLTGASEEEFYRNMESVLTSDSSVKYFSGEFIYPYGSSANIKSGYGRHFQTTGGYDYISKWVRLSASSGSEIKAVNAGKVIYVGEQTMTGRTVVVDHGLGLKSIYGNFESISVNEGDTVETGTVLGTLGNTGYTDGSKVSFAFSVNGSFVCPYEILDKDGVGLAQ